MTIQQALDQKVWAVIGATHKTEKFGYKIYKCLKDHGYEVYPVNPNIAEIDGDKCYSSLSALPVVPAVVDFVVPEAAGMAALDECKELGISTVWLQPGADKPSVVEKSTCFKPACHSRLCISSITVGGYNERIKRIKNC